MIRLKQLIGRLGKQLIRHCDGSFDQWSPSSDQKSFADLFSSMYKAIWCLQQTFHFPADLFAGKHCFEFKILISDQWSACHSLQPVKFPRLWYFQATPSEEIAREDSLKGFWGDSWGDSELGLFLAKISSGDSWQMEKILGIYLEKIADGLDLFPRKATPFWGSIFSVSCLDLALVTNC